MTQKRAGMTRQKVLEAATELALEQGFAAVSIKDVQERSGVSNGSIFHHFGSKDGIIGELFAAERRAYLGRVAEAITGYDGDPIDAFAAGACAALRYHAENRQRYQRLIVDFTDSDWIRENAELWRELAGVIEQPVISWAAPHFAAGRLPPLPPAVFQALILGPAELLSRQWLAGRLPGSPLDYADMLANYVAAGLRAELERSRERSTD